MTLNTETMTIVATFYGGPEVVEESIALIKRILEDLETISPLRRPLYISGSTPDLSYVELQTDWSDLDEYMLKILQQEELVYYDNEGVRSLDVGKAKMCASAFSVPFSNQMAAKQPAKRVTVSFILGGMRTKRIVNLTNNVVLKIHDLSADGPNSAWRDPEIVTGIMRYLIKTVKPIQCAVFNVGNVVSHTREKVCESSTLVPGHALNWMTYTANPHMIEVLKDVPEATPYADGLWIQLGKGPETMLDEQVKERSKVLIQALLDAGIPDSKSGLDKSVFLPESKFYF